MKFTTSAAIALAATGAVAQIDVLKPLFADVGKAIDALDSAAKAFDGDVDAVSSKADALIKSIKDGDKKAAGSKDLELADALGLQAPVKDLTEKGTTLESDFKAKVSDIEKAGACGTVREKLADINDASKAFIKTVVAKVPDAAQDIAAGLAAGLTKVLDQAQSDFSEENCKDSGNGGSSKPSGGASQTGGASETAAPTGGESSAPATTAAPTQTGGAGDCHTCQGGNGTAPGPTSTPVVAGAGALAPAGALVLAVAAALL